MLNWKQIIDWTSATISTMNNRMPSGANQDALRARYPSIPKIDLDAMLPEWGRLRNSLGQPGAVDSVDMVVSSLAGYYYRALQQLFQQTSPSQANRLSGLIADLIISASKLGQVRILATSPEMIMLIQDQNRRTRLATGNLLSQLDNEDEDDADQMTIQDQMDELEEGHAMEMPDDIYDDE